MNNEDLLKDFFSKHNQIKYKKNETIIRPEDEPQGIFFLKKGYVKMGLFTRDGSELIINIFKPGSYFSMLWAIAQIPNRYFFQTMTSVEVYRVPRKKVLDFLLNNPKQLMYLSRRILRGVEGLLVNIEMTRYGSAYYRVLSVIYLCMKRFGEKTDKKYIKIKPNLTHQDIADMAGITRETASIEIQKLKEKNILSYDRGIVTVHNIKNFEEEFEISKLSLREAFSL